MALTLPGNMHHDGMPLSHHGSDSEFALHFMPLCGAAMICVEQGELSVQN